MRPKKKRPSRPRPSRPPPVDRARRPGEGFVRRPVEPPIEAEGFRSGYVALVGRPNVGKSTLLNALLGQKIAATTHKPQTTRKNLMGVLHPPGAQILLLDTPGYHQAKGPLNRFMVAQARRAAKDADVVALVVEARQDGAVTPGTDALLKELQRGKKPVVLLLNKIDLLKSRQALLPQIEVYRAALGERLAAVVPISAYKKQGLETVVREIGRALPEGPKYFDEGTLTDASERQIVAEMIREKVMLATKQEIPYASAVAVERFEDGRPSGVVKIYASIFVEREGQKPIIIGRGGEALREIGRRARLDIEHFLGARVFLELHVKVLAGWSERVGALEELGLGAREEE